MLYRLQQLIVFLAGGALLLVLCIAFSPASESPNPELQGTPTAIAMVPTATSLPQLSPTPTLPPLPVSGTVFALLADNSLIGIDASSGQERMRSHLPVPQDLPRFRPTAHRMALSKDGRQVFVLDTRNERSRIYLFDVTLRGNIGLDSHIHPEASVHFTTLAVGPVTGHLYLFGNREGNLVVNVLDPQSGTLLQSWSVQVLDAEDWQAYQAAISPDEQRIFVSYHGGDQDTVGIDWFTITEDGLRPGCTPSSKHQEGGCINAHGGFALYGDRLLATTGGRIIRQLSLDGTAQQQMHVGLKNAEFILDFVLDEPAKQLYVVGPCSYNGGLSSIDLDSTTAHILATPSPAGTAPTTLNVPCGGPMALGPKPLLAIGRISRLYAQPAKSGELLLLDRNTGQIVRNVSLLSEPIDVLIAPDRPPAGRLAFEATSLVDDPNSRDSYTVNTDGYEYSKSGW